jgi:hypothetical protein
MLFVRTSVNGGGRVLKEPTFLHWYRMAKVYQSSRGLCCSTDNQNGGKTASIVCFGVAIASLPLNFHKKGRLYSDNPGGGGGGVGRLAKV